MKYKEIFEAPLSDIQFNGDFENNNYGKILVAA